MHTTDPIADLLTRIRNGQAAKHDVVTVPASKMKIAVTHILKEEGFVRAYKCIRDRQQGIIKIALKYNPMTKKSTIVGLKRISKPGLRNYVGSTSLPRVLNGLGIAILSTSKGIITDKEARKLNIGGEVLCHVY